MAENTFLYPRQASVPLVPVSTVIAIGEYIVGAAMQCTIATSRQKLPVYALGFTNPLGYGRGRRVITGVLNDVMFRVDAIGAAAMAQAYKNAGSDYPVVYKTLQAAQLAGDQDIIDRTEVLKSFLAAAGEDISQMGDFEEATYSVDVGSKVEVAKTRPAMFLDEIPPVKIYILNFLEQYGGEWKEGKYYLAIATVLEGIEFMTHGSLINVSNEAMIGEIRFLARRAKLLFPVKFDVKSA